MVALSLKIGVGNVVKTMQFEPSTMVYDACRIIRERVPEAQLGQPNDYGLFLSDEDPKKGIWLEAGKALDYYMLRNGDTLEYKKKQRPLKIRMLDGTVKTVMVDDSKIVSDMLMTICARIGITNYDEYSLVRDIGEEKKEETTGTLKRDKTLLRDDKKMEKLKQKLHTDDELLWLHGERWGKQGVEETRDLLLRKRKFFLNKSEPERGLQERPPLMFVCLCEQARDDILNGSHPVSFDKACEFAGYQCQIQFGDHNESKHKAGFLDLKEFLPKEYIKNKGERKIFQAHKNCQNMTEIEAKVSYVKLARSLKTYGVSFFLVKEKMKGKNKLVPRLLGITKESVMRVDEKTKEVIQEWSLTNIKRWAASPKSFTLDFGDYQDGYYSVQTTEGEQIAQLIAGYIDIILKKKKSKDHFGLEGDEESTMLEDSVSPKKSTVLQQQFNKVGKVETGSVALPAIMRSGAGGPESFQMGSMPQAKQHITSGQMHRGHMPPLTSAQQALTGTINSSMQAVQAAQASLDGFDTLPPLGTDAASQAWRKNKMDESKHEIHSQVDAITAGTASMVNLTAGDPAETDYTAVGCAVTTISSNLTEMSKGVKLLAALMDDEGGNGQQLLGAAKNLACAVSDMLKTAQPANTEPRQNLLQAAGNVGQASGELLSHIGETDTDPQFQDMLMQLAKAVANAAAALVLRAKNVAQKTEDSAQQNRVIAAATQCALSTSQLVACTRVVAPTISSPVCQEQLIEAGKLVAKSVEGCVEASQGATNDEGLLKQVGVAATGVTQALNELLQHIKQYASGGHPIGRHGEATDRILDVTENIFSSMGDAGEMVRQARILAQATSDLVNAIKMDAEGESDLENSRKLLSAAKLLADATAKMVEAAKGAAANPDSEEQQQKLREAAEGLRMATNAAAQNAIKKRLVNKLENAAKQAAAAATQTIAAAQHAASSNRNQAAQQQLVQSCKVVAEQIPQLVQGVRGSQSQPDSPSAQLALISASQNFLQPGAKMVTASKATVPTISDQASAMQLSQCAKNLASALAELRTASQKAQEACGPLEIDNALSMVRDLEKDMKEAKSSAEEGKLKPLPGETLEKCSQDLGTSTKAVSSAIAQLLSEATQGNENYTGMAARDIAQALKSLASAARGVGATTGDSSARNAMLDCAGDVMDKSANLIEETKRAIAKPGDAESQQRLAQVAKAVSQALNRCVNCLPGQRDVDNAIRTVGEASKTLLADSFPSSGRSFQEVQAQLNEVAAGLNQSANEVVQASRGTTQDLARATSKFGQDFSNFLEAGVDMAGTSQSKEDQTQVVSNLKTISMSSSKLLLAAKALSTDPSSPNLKNQLAAAARAVTDSINQIITMCTQQAPGQKECDNALRELESVKGMLENPTEAVTELSYFDCIDSVMENSKVLGESMAGISHNAKNSNLPEFGDSVSAGSKALCGLTEAAAQAAYLVGVSDPNSTAGQKGLVDPAQFARANQSIQMACQNLVDPACTQSQVLSAATIVAKHTSALCNACRLASSKTPNPVAKRQFVQSAKEVANTTANLVKSIKALDGAFNQENREKCKAATGPLIEAVDNLTAFASNPEFASIPAQISPEGHAAMEPIVAAAKMMLESSTGLIQTARSLAVNPKDPPKWSVLAGHSRTVSDSIKKLITNMRQTLHEQMAASVHEISNLIDPVAVAARSEASQLGHKVSQMASYFEPLIMAAIGTASKILSSQQQMAVLDQTKTLTESALQMLYTAKEAGGNPKAAHMQEALEESVQMMKEAVDDLGATLAEAASAAGAVGGMVDSINDSINKMEDTPALEPDGTFVDYQTTMVKTAKAIAVTVQEMVTKSNTNPDDLGGLANQLTNEFGNLANEAKYAAVTAENDEIGSHIKKQVGELGFSCTGLVTKAGALQCSPNDSFTKKELIESARKVSEKVSHVLASLQAGNRGTQACITAASAVSGIIADLDTTIMFATAGTLNRENAETFADHRECILKTAKALVEDTKLLVSGAGASQEKLAQAAQSSVSTITKLADVVKLGAASLGSEDPETQVVLINAVKDVAKALGNLISTTKAAAGKPHDDPSMLQLKNSAKVMVTNVTSLLKTVKAVEDEATKGTRALEATIEHIKQELAVFSSSDPPPKTTTPEEFIRMTKGITMATAKAVAAGNSCRQEDIIATANLSRRAIADMLHSCKEAAYHPEVSKDVQMRALRYGNECAVGYLGLLEHVLVIIQKPSHDLKQQLASYSKRVAGSVTELIQAAEAMKGTEWVDPEDPTVIAENELLGAAAAIEAAAKKLEQLRPRTKPKEADESLNFEEQILEAAKSIAAATSALVKAASAAQRELVAQGKVGAIPANAVDDGQWSQGLISAARMVAAATNNLCEAANSAVQGHASEEKLISSAKQVAASTAQLLVACKVKADQDSQTMKRLQAAGNAVKRASDNLVKAAQKAAFDAQDDQAVVVKSKMVGGIAQIIAAQEEMLRKERELDEARKKLAMIRQQQYKFLPSELREDGQEQ
ncbi:LOW QUALITY PROTEIN: talin-1 [Morone saxatilis]|uniref:LOW QUALITY PROTEIN: talin-1 n=1 Tax=Morone saxatilis TaxID=34816 RepID=UPI0015E1C2F5|nr:LOW QUALITY PROTEIN: talin-1 [Morone saxatilis]